MRRIRKAIKKAYKGKLKSNDSSKAKIIMPLNSGVGILTEKDQNVPKSDSLSQFPRKKNHLHDTWPKPDPYVMDNYKEGLYYFIK